MAGVRSRAESKWKVSCPRPNDCLDKTPLWRRRERPSYIMKCREFLSPDGTTAEADLGYFDKPFAWGMLRKLYTNIYMLNQTSVQRSGHARGLPAASRF